MAETNLESIVVREVGAMKAVSKPMAELDDEIEEYTSDRSTKKYQEYPGQVETHHPGGAGNSGLKFCQYLSEGDLQCQADSALERV